MTATTVERAGEAVAAPTHTLHVIDESGDSTIEWTRGNREETDAARAHFNKLKEKGYLGYRAPSGRDRGEVLREFDETAERIVMRPQLVGG